MFFSMPTITMLVTSIWYNENEKTKKDKTKTPPYRFFINMLLTKII